MTTRLSTAEFIKKAAAVHGDRYSYALTTYIGSNSLVDIVCRVHGTFSQKARKHSSGQGCPKCSGRYMDAAYFIEKAIEKHNGRYEYPDAKFTGGGNKVTILCKLHGNFSQRADGHISGKGCPVCKKTPRKTTAEFIQEAVEVHGDAFDYSKVRYTTRSNHVIITCKLHGDFNQTPKNHLLGRGGCAKCSDTSSDEDLIYIHRASGLMHNGVQVYKIGVTSQRLSKISRMNDLTKALGSELINVLYLPVEPGTAVKHERWALTRGEQPEYPAFDGSTEYRALTPWQLQDLISALVVFKK